MIRSRPRFLLSASLPAILATALLVAQVALPWSVKYFVTQDGPSHVYTAVMAGDVLIHRTSVQRAVYHFRWGAIPNWTSTILLAMIASVVGVANAERIMVDICVVAGVLAFRYCARSFGAVPGSFGPLANFLFQTWFLWLGFYNLCLGMAFLLVLVGYHIRNGCSVNLKSGAILCITTVIIFFTHLIPAALGILTILVITCWVPMESLLTKRSVVQVAQTVAWMTPGLILLLLYAAGKPRVRFNPGIVGAWEAFPLHVFATAAGAIGGQNLLKAGVLFLIAVAILGLRKSEWRSSKGALVVAALISFALYLLVPDEGLGGSMTKIRFAWAVYLLGGLVAASSLLLRRLTDPAAILIAFLLACNLVATFHALRVTSRAVEDYIAATDLIPKGATFVRLRYPTPLAIERYSLRAMGRDPLFHLDAFSAARIGSIDLSDYETLNPVFPVAQRTRIAPAQQMALWGLEGPDERTADTLAWLCDSLPVPVQYVVLVAEDESPENRNPGLGAVMKWLDSNTRLFATSRGTTFVRVYERVHQSNQ